PGGLPASQGPRPGARAPRDRGRRAEGGLSASQADLLARDRRGTERPAVLGPHLSRRRARGGRGGAAAGGGAAGGGRGCMRPRLTIQPAARDATLATVLLLAAIWAGSHGFADVDRALLGYLAATLVATFGTVLRASAFWRRPASAFFARALVSALRSP